MPNMAPLIPRKCIGDERSVEMWMSWVKKSKLMAKTKLEALEEHEAKLAEPEP